ncbi:MAG: SH3 domain-containing protein [Leptolyngbya sp. LCM1.Bin17]|nr:MAG: SH3 domain-containing protein [Leptolyngbya sp. LCM1.Bin17]
MPSVTYEENRIPVSIHTFSKIITFSALASMVMLPAAQAGTDVGDEEFHLGRAREACQQQAERQLLTFNNVVESHLVTGSGGRMIGADVTMSVTRGGQTYNVRCQYDNMSRVATIVTVDNQNARRATVDASLANVRVGPSQNYPMSYQLRRGAEVLILAEQWQTDGVWYKVRPASGAMTDQIGWIFGDLLAY